MKENSKTERLRKEIYERSQLHAQNAQMKHQLESALLKNAVFRKAERDPDA